MVSLRDSFSNYCNIAIRERITSEKVSKISIKHKTIVKINRYLLYTRVRNRLDTSLGILETNSSIAFSSSSLKLKKCAKEYKKELTIRPVDSHIELD